MDRIIITFCYEKKNISPTIYEHIMLSNQGCAQYTNTYPAINTDLQDYVSHDSSIIETKRKQQRKASYSSSFIIMYILKNKIVERAA